MAGSSEAQMFVGAGMYDITGPIGIGTMGYNVGTQTCGLHTRLWARAFVMAENEVSPSTSRSVFVSADLGQVSYAVKKAVVEELASRGLGQWYDEANVMISATHTHAGPGGTFHTDAELYNFMIGGLSHIASSLTRGYSRQNFEIIVQGITESIVRAHRNAKPGFVSLARGSVQGVGTNRSLEAFRANHLPADEATPNPSMIVLRLTASDGSEVGAISWYPVHGTSLDKNNCLISGDNKGVCSYLMERSRGAKYQEGSFVAACAQSDCGDVSPNLFQDGMEEWHGPGGDDDLKSAEIVGRTQFEVFDALSNSAQPLTGSVRVAHRIVDFTSIDLGDGRRTCPPAIGSPMTGGTEDGRQTFLATKEGVTCDDDCDPCHGSKDITWKIPATNERFLGIFEGTWLPTRLPVQLFRIGDVAIAGVPAEFTTVAGRLLRQTLRDALRVEDVVIAGLSNAYSGYVTTPEEYAVQHYEGASTLYGPHTLGAYQRVLEQLAAELEGESPPDDAIPRAAPPHGDEPGYVLVPERGFSRPVMTEVLSGAVVNHSTVDGSASVEARFVTEHPNFDLHIAESFFTIDRLEGDHWRTVARDRDPNTVARWEAAFRSSGVGPPGLRYTNLTVRWSVPPEGEPGQYRIAYWPTSQTGCPACAGPGEPVSTEFSLP